MDVRISGSGVIPAGEYDNINVSGSGRMSGTVRCASLSSSGSLKGESIDCLGRMKTSGSVRFSESVKTNFLSVSGSFSCGGDIFASDSIGTSGSFKCGGNIKCNRMKISGSARVGSDIEAEKIEVSGALTCGGLINAEDIYVKSCDKLDAANIGGTRVVISMSIFKRIIKRIPLLSLAIKNACVKYSIEADEVTCQYVSCRRVTGRVVKIGRGCRIDVVEYSEHVEIDKRAKVGRTEKI